MKATNFFIALILLAGTAFGQDSKVSEPDPMILKDPRLDAYKVWPSEYFRDGSDLPLTRSMPYSNAVLIIARMNIRDGTACDYQISGIDGRHSKERVESFLKAYYAPPEGDPKKGEASNVIILGDNWGAGGDLFELLKRLSKERAFSVYATMTPFHQVQLMDEPKDRLAAIRHAFEASAPK